MEMVNKPPCKYGIKCYRKSQAHFNIYSHPEEFLKQLENERPSRDKVSSQSRKTSKRVSSKTKTNDCSSKNKVNNATQERKGKEGFEFSRDSRPQENASDDLIKIKSCETKSCFNKGDLKDKTVEEIIKILFLVNMPPDFYSFYEFYKSVIEKHHLEALKMSKLKLVGPFEVLSGTINYSMEEDFYLCYWRFYYDPPEFQTVLVTESGFHIGYWRDKPKENPVFLASNNPNKNCIFKLEAENIFGTVFHYLNDQIHKADTFQKVKIAQLLTALRDWAKKNKFSLEKETSKISSRQKKIVAKTFHNMGIVVPVEPKTGVGYRPLIETECNLKKICNLIMNAEDDTEKESLWENLQVLINAANIANDECDFGNSLELGIDLFCMGSSVFHETVKHLLCTAYSLLDRTEYSRIVEAHLKFRRKGNE